VSEPWQDGLDEWQQGSWREVLAANHADPDQHEGGADER
jgi:hypothetical protein